MLTTLAEGIAVAAVARLTTWPDKDWLCGVGGLRPTDDGKVTVLDLEFAGATDGGLVMVHGGADGKLEVGVEDCDGDDFLFLLLWCART